MYRKDEKNENHIIREYYSGRCTSKTPQINIKEPKK